MEFVSIPFTALLTVTFILYYLKTNRHWQHGLLLLASLVFAGYYHFIYIVYAIGINVFTFYAGKWLAAVRGRKQAPYVFVGSLAALVGTWLIARYWAPLFPLGISFYTFQALSYLIEIYWDEEPEDSLMDFTLYMLLFMKFLSGPIERGFDLLPQLKRARRFDYDNVVYGMKLVVWGAFMKLVIADRIAPSLDTVFSNVQEASGIQLLVVTLIYPIQLYADFAGYTLMAIGLGQMFGVRLSPNFDRPFVSLTTGELWRRWHISLSAWVRDYVFMPMSAATRKWKRWGVYSSLIVTFVVIGVWHGAGWAFALYGLFQGIVVVYETAASRFRDGVRRLLPASVYNPLQMMRTYVLFALSLLFFRLPKIDDVLYTYRHLLDGFETNIKELRLGMTDSQWIYFGVSVLLMFLLEYAHSRVDILEWTSRRPIWQRWPIYFTTILLIFLFGAFGVENFIYVQF